MSILNIAILLGMAVISFFTAYRCCRGDGWRRAAVRFADAIGWVALVCWTPSLIANAVDSVVAWIALVSLTVATAIFGRLPDGRSTTVSALNFLVLQWLGVRLVRETVPGRLETVGLKYAGPGKLAVERNYAPATGRWHLARWVWPLTGWWSPVRWIARRP